MFVGYMRNDLFSYLFLKKNKSVVFCRMLGKLQNSRWQNKLIYVHNTRRRKERSGRDVAQKTQRGSKQLTLLVTAY